ncbi:UDP-N-acetylmuramate dehydrogenase [Methylacidimicrobium cyclopophantes]|uniref:UDP-N-acetylenolpyruvoylglucosamine reductase n=1 Tax=Methylacidimicrobium cyclopophantes TaxID=1041766 RepID=A0A5E6MDK6_9BACT|nr:UDP-N-acetylmuramate dehydrogenase [Methylacidimicrobium cyclopophantes]VVM07541.1 UDP-N-acetylmuramate dehydrogenase [Methylacidimicrobium cyclopophantes]
MQIRENVPLAPLTTLGIGGRARFFTEARTEAEAREALSWATERELPLFLLGGGSNLVIADSGFPGLVLKIAIRGVEPGWENGKRLYWVGAGETWDPFVLRTVADGSPGLALLSGIPGTVGGTPIQNVGAYGAEVASSIRTVRALDRRNGRIVELSAAACSFGYRKSIFNTEEKERYLLLAVCYALPRDGDAKLRYPDLLSYFARKENPPSVKEIREAVLQIRRSKAMLVSRDEEDSRSVGSFFKNPILEPAAFAELQERAEKRGLTPPSFPAGGGKRKVPAAWLVENAGFPKGLDRGSIGISRFHALAIVNRGGATAAEVVAFMIEIQNAVEALFAVRLDPEPVFVGFESR